MSEPVLKIPGNSFKYFLMKIYSNTYQEFLPKSSGFVLKFMICMFIVNCSSPYVKNRSRDFVDVFTFEMQTESYGAALYAGPAALGIDYKSQNGKAAGLRGGQIGSYNSAGFTALAFGSDYLTPSKIDFDAVWKPKIKKNESKVNETTKTNDVDDALDALEGDETLVNDEIVTGKQSDSESLLVLRKKAFQARVPFGTIRPAYLNKDLFKNKKTRWAPAYYFTRLELQLGLYFGVRIGINPGEFLDFLFGFFTADMYDDDEPWTQSLEERLLDSPEFKKLPPEYKKRLLEQLKKNPAEALPF